MNRRRRNHRWWTLGVASLAAGLALTMIGAKWAAERDVERMTEAARQFLGSLTAEQRARAVFAFEAEERQRFHFIPNEMFERHGIMLKDLDAQQDGRAHDLLRAGLSQRGYLTSQQILELEGVLAALEGENRRFPRDPGDYYLSVFGTPEAGGTWGWRFEGHHMSFHFTVVDGQTTVSTPTFLGANPAEVRQGAKRGLRPLADQEERGRALLAALDDRQRAVAVIEDVAPRDIVTGAALAVDPLSPVGIRASALNGAQRALLMRLVEAYTSLMADDIAEARMADLRAAGVENLAFAWAGSSEPGVGSYYRVQGPTFLIEFDNTQNDANHIHTAWRDFDGDLGRDLLREHLRQHAH